MRIISKANQHISSNKRKLNKYISACSLLFLLSISMSFSQYECYTHPETMPRLAGCVEDDNNCTREKILKRIREHFRYPGELIDQCWSGVIVVTLNIGEDGTLSDCTISKGLHPLFDEEVLRCIKLIEEWIPGSRNNIPVATSIGFPVNIGLP